MIDRHPSGRGIQRREPNGGSSTPPRFHRGKSSAARDRKRLAEEAIAVSPTLCDICGSDVRA